METVISGQLFEWDDEKAKKNKIKHNVSFKTATAVFDDPNRIEEYDYLHSWNEERWQVTGMAGDILFVIYTERKESIRLISARKATEKERIRYYGNNSILLSENGNASDSGGES